VFGDKMSELVVAIDMGEEALSKDDAFEQWFKDRNYDIGEETIMNEYVQLKYNRYSRANVVIFKYEYEDEDVVFPKAIIDFLESLTDSKKTQVSVAEDTPYGYETIVELKLGAFLTAFYEDTETGE
jgi:hypothetical protein